MPGVTLSAGPRRSPRTDLPFRPALRAGLALGAAVWLACNGAEPPEDRRDGISRRGRGLHRSGLLFSPGIPVARDGKVYLPTGDGAEDEPGPLAIAGRDAAGPIDTAEPNRPLAGAATPPLPFGGRRFSRQWETLQS